MTDERFVYVQDQRERRQEASGARYMKGKRGGKTCRLGTDYMTKKELEAMNGTCASVTLGELITVDQFKALPDDLKLKWVNSVITKYGVSTPTISKELFGMGKNWVYNQFYKKNMGQYVNVVRHPLPNDVDHFINACLLFLCPDEYKTPVEEPDYIPEEDEEEDQDDEFDDDDPIDIPEPPKPAFPSIAGVTHIDLDFSKIDDNFLGLLKLLCEGKRLKGIINIDFYEEDEDE